MRRELVAAALALTLGAAQAHCTLVFGQGRNPTLLGGPDWDALNHRFNTAVAEALTAAGRQVHASTGSSQQIDPPTTGRALLAQADRLGCRTLVETAVFAEDETLVLRLRAYPLVPALGADGAVAGLRIGPPAFVTQRDAPSAALLRLSPERLAMQMAADYLQRERR